MLTSFTIYIHHVVWMI